MTTEISFWVINGVTILLLISPLFVILSCSLVIVFLLILPLTIYILYRYFSLPRSKSSFNQFEKITIAHRGGRPLISSNEEFPENTMAAYRWAFNVPGVNGIELDIWLSRDHVPMVNHDGYLEHTFAQCPQFISSLTCEELRQLKYLKRNKRDIYDQIGCEVIPTLEEVIVFLEPTNLKLMIEIKETQKIPEMAKIIDDLYRKYPFLYERAYCAAFHPSNIYTIRRLNPRITTAFLFAPNITKYMIHNAKQTPKHTPAGLKFLGADLICIEQRQVSQNLLDTYKNTSIVVCSWNVNDPGQRQWLKANGVTIITDTLFDID